MRSRFSLLSTCVLFVFSFSSWQYASADSTELMNIQGKVTVLNIMQNIDRVRSKVGFAKAYRTKQCLRELPGKEGYLPVRKFLKKAVPHIESQNNLGAANRRTARALRKLCRVQKKAKRTRRTATKLLRLRTKVESALTILPPPLSGGQETNLVPEFSDGIEELEILVVDQQGNKVVPLQVTQITICGLSDASPVCLKTRAGDSSLIKPAIPAGDFKEYSLKIKQPGTLLNYKYSPLPAKITLKQVPIAPKKIQTSDLEEKSVALRASFTRPDTAEVQTMEVVLPIGTSFQTASGKKVSGEINYILKPIDSTSFTAPPMDVVDASGNPGKLISMGMGFVDLFDNDGEKIEVVNPPSGAKARFTFLQPLQTEEQKSNNLALKEEFSFWTLDSDSGTWTEGLPKSGSLSIMSEDEVPIEINEDGTSTVEVPPVVINETAANVDRAEFRATLGCVGIHVNCWERMYLRGYVQGKNGEVQPLPDRTTKVLAMYAFSNLIAGEFVMEWEYEGDDSMVNTDLYNGFPAYFIRDLDTNPIRFEISDDESEECQTVEIECNGFGGGTTPSFPSLPEPDDGDDGGDDEPDYGDGPILDQPL